MKHSRALRTLGAAIVLFGWLGADSARGEPLTDILQVEAAVTSFDDLKPVAADQAKPANRPKFKSTKLETVTFEGDFTPTVDAPRLAVFSDDGVDVWIDGTRIHSCKGVGQHLPSLGESLHRLSPSTPLVKGQQYHIKVEYSNTIYKGETDIDGCTLFVYGAVVEMLIDETDDESDDYVPLKKDDLVRRTPHNIPWGLDDNAMLMVVRYNGPTGSAATVKLSVDGIGSVEIKELNGDPYPDEGVSVAVGTDHYVKLYGTKPSDNLDDVKITATIGTETKGTKTLTVLWIYAYAARFRGSDQQDTPLDPKSEAQGTDGIPLKAGIQLGPATDPVKRNVGACEETRWTISPDKVIRHVEWMIWKELSVATWGPGTGTLTRRTIGTSNWEFDLVGRHGFDLDLKQQLDSKWLFSQDAPGYRTLSLNPDWRFCFKGKFREWAEVKIGPRWYVVSGYKEWRVVLHGKYQNATIGWVTDTTQTNEVVEGSLEGFAESWTE